MLFLHDLPDWMMALSIVATVVALCYAGYFAFHRVYRPWFPGLACFAFVAGLAACSGAVRPTPPPELPALTRESASPEASTTRYNCERDVASVTPALIRFPLSARIGRRVAIQPI